MATIDLEGIVRELEAAGVEVQFYGSHLLAFDNRPGRRQDGVYVERTGKIKSDTIDHIALDIIRNHVAPAPTDALRAAAQALQRSAQPYHDDNTGKDFPHLTVIDTVDYDALCAALDAPSVAGVIPPESRPLTRDERIVIGRSCSPVNRSDRYYIQQCDHIIAQLAKIRPNEFGWVVNDDQG